MMMISFDRREEVSIIRREDDRIKSGMTVTVFLLEVEMEDEEEDITVETT